jgi:hypothetical protein
MPLLPGAVHSPRGKVEDLPSDGEYRFERAAVRLPCSDAAVLFLDIDLERRRVSSTRLSDLEPVTSATLFLVLTSDFDLQDWVLTALFVFGRYAAELDQCFEDALGDLF